MDRRAVAALIVLGLLGMLGALTYAFWSGNPIRRIRRELDQGLPAQALHRAQGACMAGCPADVRALQAAALHALGRHEEELAVVSGLTAVELSRLDPRAVAALAEDFGKGDEPDAIRAQLARAPAPKVVPPLRDLAQGPASPAQWGALRYLDGAKAAEGLPLPKLYAEALGREDCRVRATAARRLGELGDASTAPALRTLAKAPVTGGGCGQEEAAGALRKLSQP
jgi:serine/threonine-protein kinase